MSEHLIILGEFPMPDPHEDGQWDVFADSAHSLNEIPPFDSRHELTEIIDKRPDLRELAIELHTSLRSLGHAGKYPQE